MRKRVPPMSRISRSFLAALLIALLLPAALILPAPGRLGGHGQGDEL